MVSPDYEAIVTDRFKDDLTAEVIWRLENAGQSSAERLIRPNVRCLLGCCLPQFVQNMPMPLE